MAWRSGRRDGDGGAKLLSSHELPENERVDPGAKKDVYRVALAADDWFAKSVERRVDSDWNAGRRRVLLHSGHFSLDKLTSKRSLKGNHIIPIDL